MNGNEFRKRLDVPDNSCLAFELYLQRMAKQKNLKARQESFQACALKPRKRHRGPLPKARPLSNEMFNRAVNRDYDARALVHKALGTNGRAHL